MLGLSTLGRLSVWDTEDRISLLDVNDYLRNCVSPRGSSLAGRLAVLLSGQ